MAHLCTASDRQNILQQAWQLAIWGEEELTTASQMAECLIDKGGDVYRRTERFVVRESLYIAALSVVTVIRRQCSFILLVRQLRLLATLQYLGGQDLHQEAARLRAVKALYGTALDTVIFHSPILLQVPGNIRRTYQAGRLFHRRYVAPIFPPSAPLR